MRSRWRTTITSRLDLRVVVRIVGGEEADRLGVDGLEARGRVGELSGRVSSETDPREPRIPSSTRNGER